MSYPPYNYNPNLPPLRPKREFSGKKWFLIIVGVGVGLAALFIGVATIGITIGKSF